MIEVRQTPVFTAWLENLRDRQARTRIYVRMNRLTQGLLGDVKPVGSGISELRVDYGPGYRIYLQQRGRTLIILLAGGDKGTQERDIKRAVAIARNL